MSEFYKEDDAISMLLEAMLVGSSEMIENQEARGQQNLVNSAVLPKQMDAETKEALIYHGVVFVEYEDDLFVRAELPSGWKKIATDHSMWSNLVDKKGRTRARIFYKAAFYDRSAHMSATSRYRVNCYVSCDKDGNKSEDEGADHFLVTVQDAGKDVARFGYSKKYSDYDKADKIRKSAELWIERNYPDHNSKKAYW